MRRNLIFVSALLWYLPAKSQFTDSFQDGSLLNNPTWIFQNTDFEILNGKLHTTNNNGGAVQYGISSAWNIQGAEVFDFDFELLANPSSSNYMEVFLAADTLVEISKNGYFIRIGDLKDEISLYRIVNGIRTELISGKDGELNKTSNKYHVRVLRDTLANWKLIYRNAATNVADSFGTVADSTFTVSKFAGIRIVQNGTGIIGKHYLDNFRYGTYPRDTVKPKMSYVSVIFPSRLVAGFQEAIQPLGVAEFYVQNFGSPSNVSIDPQNPKQVFLDFSAPFAKNKSYVLQNENTSDLSGNKSAWCTIPFFTAFADTPHAGDLIFTEIMANPTPSVGFIPEVEYVEVKNTTNNYLQLFHCTLSDPTSIVQLPDTILAPYSYAVICKNTSTSLQSTGIKWIGTSTFPGLNNDEDELYLRNKNGELLSYVNYKETWHSDGLKRNGGWSLELIDTNYSCVATHNWKSNNSNGGTPGKQNSVVGPLLQIPEFRAIRLYALSDRSIRVYLSQTPDSGLISPASFSVIGNPNTVARICNFYPKTHSFDLIFSSPFAADQVYQLEITSILSCYGTALEHQTLPFGYGSLTAGNADVLLNEILFDPKGHDADYVELYNASEKILDLKGLLIASLDASGNPDQTAVIAPDGYTFFPGTYVWISEDPQILVRQYPYSDSSNAIAISDLPTFPNDAGHVALYNNLSLQIDAFQYTDDMHAPVISNPEGISLEKTILMQPAREARCWTSAASSVYYGTPGLKNSQLISNKNYTAFNIPVGYFTPDDDGFTDLLKIGYLVDEPGYFLHARVFAENGAEIAYPFQNYSIESAGTLVWDGKTEDGVISPGNYVLFVEGYHASGKTFQHKLEFSVLKRP